jgi:hypothetical protein
LSWSPLFDASAMNPDAGQVTDGDITIDSNHETTDQISVAFQDDPPPPSEDAPAVEAVEAVEAVDEAVPAPPKKRTRRNDPGEAVKSAIAKQREDLGTVQGDAGGTHGRSVSVLRGLQHGPGRVCLGREAHRA